MKNWIRKAVFAGAAAFLILAGTALAQGTDHDGCSDSTLNGDYAFRLSGQIFNPNGTTTLRDGVAMTHFNGSGVLNQVDFVMSNGTALPGLTDPTTGFHADESGSYTVNSDCTGSAEIDFPAPPGVSSGAVIKLKFVIGDHGRTIHAIVSELIPPGLKTPVPVSIHSDAEKVGSSWSDGDR
ncbi:MAG: hypothetical protein ACRD52_14405 [Candidatus Acidiferrales bacterium]